MKYRKFIYSSHKKSVDGRQLTSCLDCTSKGVSTVFMYDHFYCKRGVVENDDRHRIFFVLTSLSGTSDQILYYTLPNQCCYALFHHHLLIYNHNGLVSQNIVNIIMKIMMNKLLNGPILFVL